MSQFPQFSSSAIMYGMMSNKTSTVFFILCLLANILSASQMPINPMQVSDAAAFEDLPCHGDSQQSSQQASCCEGGCSLCLSVNAIPMACVAIDLLQPASHLAVYLQSAVEFEPDRIYHPPIRS